MSSGLDAVRAALLAAGADAVLGDDLDEFAVVVMRHIEERVGAELLATLDPDEAAVIGDLLVAGRDDAVAARLAAAIPDFEAITAARFDQILAAAIAGVFAPDTLAR